MDSFTRAVTVVFEHEGGLVDNPNDPGGITNYGISLRWAMQEMAASEGSAEVLEVFDVDQDGDVDADDIRAMDEGAARLAYKRFFWVPNGYGRLLHDFISTKVLDMSVNMGARQSHKLVQRAVRAATGEAIADDGILGRITLNSVNAAEPDALLAAMRSEQAGFYRALIMRNAALRKKGHDVHDFSVFETGWLRRAYA